MLIRMIDQSDRRTVVERPSVHELFVATEPIRWADSCPIPPHGSKPVMVEGKRVTWFGGAFAALFSPSDTGREAAVW